MSIVQLFNAYANIAYNSLLDVAKTSFVNGTSSFYVSLNNSSEYNDVFDSRYVLIDIRNNSIFETADVKPLNTLLPSANLSLSESSPLIFKSRLLSRAILKNIESKPRGLPTMNMHSNLSETEFSAPSYYLWDEDSAVTHHATARVPADNVQPSTSYIELRGKEDQREILQTPIDEQRRLAEEAARVAAAVEEQEQQRRLAEEEAARVAAAAAVEEQEQQRRLAEEEAARVAAAAAAAAEEQEQQQRLAEEEAVRVAAAAAAAAAEEQEQQRRLAEEEAVRVTAAAAAAAEEQEQQRRLAEEEAARVAAAAAAAAAAEEQEQQRRLAEEEAAKKVESSEVCSQAEEASLYSVATFPFVSAKDVNDAPEVVQLRLSINAVVYEFEFLSSTDPGVASEQLATKFCQSKRNAQLEDRFSMIRTKSQDVQTAAYHQALVNGCIKPVGKELFKRIKERR